MVTVSAKGAPSISQKEALPYMATLAPFMYILDFSCQEIWGPVKVAIPSDKDSLNRIP